MHAHAQRTHELPHVRRRHVPLRDQPIRQPGEGYARGQHGHVHDEEEEAVLLVAELEHAHRVLGHVGHHGVAAPVPADAHYHERPEGHRGQQVPPGHGRRVRVRVLAQLVVQLLRLGLRDERVLPRAAVAQDDPEQIPDDAEAAEHVVHAGPVHQPDDGTEAQRYEQDAESRAHVDEGGYLAALLRGDPLGQHHRHGRLGRALAQAHHDAQRDEARRAAPGYRRRGDDGEEGREQDAQAEGVLAAEALGQDAARYVAQDEAPVEGAQDYALMVEIVYFSI